MSRFKDLQLLDAYLSPKDPNSPQERIEANKRLQKFLKVNLDLTKRFVQETKISRQKSGEFQVDLR